MDYRKYIFPVFKKDTSSKNSGNIFKTLIQEYFCIGNGFIIDDYFITASHVISNSSAYIYINEKEYYLTKDSAYIRKEMPKDKNGNPIGHDDPSNGDIAIFKIPGIKSDLFLADTMPVCGTEMKCDFYYNIGPEEGKYESFNINQKELYYWKTTGTIRKENTETFFGADMMPIHSNAGGSSGSPLIKDNIVYGILSAGNQENTSICIFYSAFAALQLLKKYKTSN